jgi:hypothetical protein
VLQIALCTGGSWRLHNCFDGLKVNPKNVPPILIIPERSYAETDVEVNGHTYKRQKIEVLMLRGCEEMCRTLRPGFVSLSPTCVQTYLYLYSPDAEEMCYLFELKYAETAERWRENSRYEVPPLLVVEHTCAHPSE